MSPYERLAQLYAENPREETFSHYVVWHSINGFFYSTPDFCIFGRPAVKASLESIGPTYGLERNPDTWYIHAFSGDMSKAWSIMPYYLPYIAFERLRAGKLDLTIQKTERIRNLTDLATL